MKAFLAFLMLTLAFVANSASAQLVLPNDTLEVIAAKKTLNIDESRYTPVQDAQSGWYYDPAVPNQGFFLHVQKEGEFGRSANVIWFLGDSNGDAKPEWYYTSVKPQRFENTYPVWITNTPFPSNGESGALVERGDARVFPLDCNNFLVYMTLDGLEQTYTARALVKERPEAVCYTCPAVDFAPLPEQCRY